MPLYFTKDEIEYLEQLLTGDMPSPFWCKDKILDKLNTEKERFENMIECEHTYKEYKGKKTWCSKCGAMDEDMSIEWDLTA